MRDTWMLSSMVVTPSYEIEWDNITYGDGIYLFDARGRRYIDGSGCASAVSSIGHGSQRIADVMQRQAATIAVTPTHQFSNAEVENYCRELVEFGPDSMRLAWTATSGSDAVESAAKLAIQYQRLIGAPERSIILGRRQSWHGSTIGALGLSGNTSRRGPFEDVLAPSPTVVPPYCYRCPFGLDPSYCDLACANDLERAIGEQGHDKVAAVIVEPVVGATLGAVVPPQGYLARLRSICDSHGILLIADEVLTGAGRTGKPFAVMHEPVEPDIIAFGKGFSGGYIPLSGLLVSARVAEPFMRENIPFMSGHTHACSPITAAVGREVLQVLKQLLESGHVAHVSQLFQDALRRELASLPNVGDVRGVGMLAGVEFVADRSRRQPFDPEVDFVGRVARAAADRGLIVYPGRGSAGFGRGEHLKLAPPLTTTPAQVSEIVQILAASISSVEPAELAA